MFNNQVWLALALIGTFSTIFVLGLVVDTMGSTRDADMQRCCKRR